MEQEKRKTPEKINRSRWRGHSFIFQVKLFLVKSLLGFYKKSLIEEFIWFLRVLPYRPCPYVFGILLNHSLFHVLSFRPHVSRLLGHWELCEVSVTKLKLKVVSLPQTRASLTPFMMSDFIGLLFAGFWLFNISIHLLLWHPLDIRFYFPVHRGFSKWMNRIK